MKFEVCVLCHPNAEGYQRNYKLPSDERFRILKVSEAHPKNEGIDQLGTTIEVFATLDEPSGLDALYAVADCIFDVALADSFLDIEISPK